MDQFVLPRLMQDAAARMRLDLEETRNALSHNASKGAAMEGAVRQFLRDRLPESVGVTSGQVIDSRGGISKQMDVILFSALHTPKAFSTKDKGIELVPVEGVIGIVEVKTKVTNTDAAAVVANMVSVKQLERSAYQPDHPSSTVIRSYSAYGRTLRASPIVYSLLAFESSELHSLGAALRDAQAGYPIDRRVDNACLLERGVLVNHIDGDYINALPSPGTTLGSYETAHALLLWFIVNAKYHLEAGMPAINLVQYLGPNFQF